jgi:hypothetical protein
MWSTTTLRYRRRERRQTKAQKEQQWTAVVHGSGMAHQR